MARQLGYEGRHENHWKCQDATTTTTIVVIFSHTKNTQKFQRERGKKKGTRTKYCAKFLCKWGGAKVAPKKSMQWSAFSFHNGCCPFVPPPPKKKNIHNIGFIYLFILFCNGYCPFMPQKRKDKEKEKKVHSSRREKNMALKGRVHVG
jgi:hypothetical protein